jgi:hypothetical protein
MANRNRHLANNSVDVDEMKDGRLNGNSGEGGEHQSGSGCAGSSSWMTCDVIGSSLRPIRTASSRAKGSA